MKTKLMLFCGITACLFAFLLSCGNKTTVTDKGDNNITKYTIPDTAGLESVSGANANSKSAIPADSVASDKDISMTLPEQKTKPATSSTVPDINKKQPATAKVTEKNQTKHNTGNTKPVNGQPDDNKTDITTGSTTKAQPSLPVTNNAKPQNQLPPATTETKPMHPKDPLPPKPAETLGIFFSAADNFLKNNVLQGSGLVNYQHIKADKTELNALAFKIASANLNQTTDAEKQAFYVNAYNILVIKQVIDNNLPASPLDVPGFFNQTKFQVAGKTLTLDQLEKNTLFGLKNDPRFHFVLVCAAKGCPPLSNTAYLPKTLNQQLDQQTTAAVNSPGFVKINAAAKKISVSKIFEWYGAHFTAGGKSVIGFMNQYRNTPIPENYAVEFYEYDWSLNRQ